MILDVELEHSRWIESPWRFEAGTPPVAEAVALARRSITWKSWEWSGCASMSGGWPLTLWSVLPGPRASSFTAARSRSAVGRTFAFNIEDGRGGIIHPHDVGSYLRQPGDRDPGRPSLRQAADAAFRCAGDVPRLVLSLQHGTRSSTACWRRSQGQGILWRSLNMEYRGAVPGNPARPLPSPPSPLPGPAGERFPVKHQNPLCGDELLLRLELDGRGRVAEICFKGHGCSISQASASMMSEAVRGLDARGGPGADRDGPPDDARRARWGPGPGGHRGPLGGGEVPGAGSSAPCWPGWRSRMP